MPADAEPRRAFDAVATDYDAARPGYPDAMYADLLALARVPAGGRVLEVGCGTGQATLPLARRGLHVTCVELGERLAAVARHNLAGYPQVTVAVADFETWPAPEGAFELVFAATAWHWIDPAIGYAKAAWALTPDGALAVAWNRHVRDAADSGFADAVRQVYEREAPALAGSTFALPSTASLPDGSAGLCASGHFSEVIRRQYPYRLTYDAASYLRLLTTFSDHRTLPAAVRARLLAGIRALIERDFGGRIVRGYVADLYIARRAAAGRTIQ